MAEKFTDLFVKNLKPKDKEHVVREKGGFGVRVMPSGRKVFFFMYRIDGHRRFLNLGTYKDTNYPNGVRKVFNWAVERDILEHSPCDGVFGVLEIGIVKRA